MVTKDLHTIRFSKSFPSDFHRSLIQALFIAALLFPSINSNTAAASEPPPNIVLIMVDDLGYAELGCYGQKKIETPRIDALAAQGMRFTQFYAGSAVCAPSRCTLLTGMHGGHAHVRSNLQVELWDSYLGQTPLPEGIATIGAMMKHAGYTTGAFGKWGLGGVETSGDPLRQGFDRFFGYNCQAHAHNLYPRYLIDNDKKRILKGNDRTATGEQYAPQLVADSILNFVRENKNRPFFAYYPTVLPHLALQAPEEDIAHYRGRWPETPYEGDRYEHHPTPRACYAAMITFMDRQVGRLLDLLDELDLADNTMVIFTSDNGTTHLADEVDYEFFESVGPLRGLKGSLYEGGIRVPMIVRWPGHVAENSQSDEIGANYDLFATIADLVRASMPETDGVSLLPTFLGQDTPLSPRYLFWDFTGYGGQIAVRQGKWKAIRKDLIKNPDAPLELYDLVNDIGETTNVADANSEIVAEMARIMVDGRTEPEIEEFRFGEYSVVE